MKILSIHAFLDATKKACKRFPFALLFLIIGCVYLILINHLPDEINGRHYYYKNIVWTAYLGMLLELVLAVFGERYFLSRGKSLFAGIIGAALLIVYYYSLPGQFSQVKSEQFLLFIIGLHLLISFAPFIGKGEVTGFWVYNKSLFLRILLAALYSGVLYLGLSLAMLAVEKLFNVEIHSKYYFDLWILIAGAFNTIFFLAGFPADFEKLDLQKEYPKGLKNFTQYVLLPIITIYLLILYAYMSRIILIRQWPYGWVSYLVLAFSILGILSLLLIHPIRNEENHKWILIFGRFFYFALCPLIILLLLSIEKRVNAYGITELRYFVMALTFWLIFITIYFIFSTEKNIKIIPLSLCIMAFLISFGPWGVFSVSLKSQIKRLDQFFLMNNMMPEADRVIPAKSKLHEGDATQISSIIGYLVNTHGYNSLQPYFSMNLDSLMHDEKGQKLDYTYRQSEKLLSYLHIDETSDNYQQGEKNFEISSDPGMDTVIQIKGYDYLIRDYSTNFAYADTGASVYYYGQDQIKLLFVNATGQLLIQPDTNDPIYFDIRSLASFSPPLNKYNSMIKKENLSLIGENKHLSVKIIFRNIQGSLRNDSPHINLIKADLLLRIKNLAVEK
jgi:hypothetical protein